MFRLLDHNEADIVCKLDSHIYNTNYVIATEERVGVHFVVSSHHPLAVRHSVTIEELLAQPFLLTEKGMGVSFLPDYVTESAVRRGTVSRLSVAGFEPELWKQLLYHRDKWVSPQMQAVIGHFASALISDAVS